MAPLEVEPGALHVVWNIPSADVVSAKNLQDRLVEGRDSKLFMLSHWGVADGEAHAVLVPQSALDEIADLIWSSGHAPAVISCGRSR